MKSLVNFLLFQAFWFVTVSSASRGHLWLGPGALVVFLCAHLAMIRGRRERARELGYALSVGLAGSVLDSLLGALGATAYPSSQASWPHAWVPPWITSLWIGFALLPRFSLAWLSGRPALSMLLGALGGPLSFLAGTRFGAVGVGDDALTSWGLLSAEYALALPLMLRFARPERARAGRALRLANS